MGRKHTHNIWQEKDVYVKHCMYNRYSSAYEEDMFATAKLMTVIAVTTNKMWLRVNKALAIFYMIYEVSASYGIYMIPLGYVTWSQYVKETLKTLSNIYAV